MSNSIDLKTIIFQTGQRANTDYVWMIGQAPGLGEQNLSKTCALHSAAFGSHMVSGHIFSHVDDPTNAFAGLFDRSLFVESSPPPDLARRIFEKIMRTKLDDGGPVARRVTTIADPSGLFHLDLVRDGVYWPIATIFERGPVRAQERMNGSSLCDMTIKRQVVFL